MKRFVIYILTWLCLATSIYAQQPDAGYQPVDRENIAAKNYYFVSLLKYLPKMRDLISRDSVFKALSAHKYKQLSEAKSPEEQMTAFRFSEAEIRTVKNHLASIWQHGNEWDQLVTYHLIPSGNYILSHVTSHVELLQYAWLQDAEGINYAINVYAGGKKPNYPLIDSISFDIHSKRFLSLMDACRENIQAICEESNLFFDVPLTTVLTFLDINDRSEAVDFEPLAATVNKNSYKYIRKTDWDRFPYSVILVLGAGPEEKDVVLSPEGKLRSHYAAELYHKGMAPFIMVSGGRVHPYKTPFNEAYEMKKYLTETCHIPEHAIIMEPHARHTTTNVRNAARIFFRQGIPMDKCALMTSSVSHISSVENSDFEKRCLREIKMKPYRLGKRLSPRLIEFYPVIDALHINPLEPLDP